MSLAQRDHLIRQSWIPAEIRQPQTLPNGPHFPVTVMAVVDDPRLRINGDEPFVDIAAWWPSLRIWTVTHQCLADHTNTTTDYPVRVTYWQPQLPLPNTPYQGL